MANKQLAELFRYDSNLQEEPDGLICGVHNGYYTTIKILQSIKIVDININGCAESDQQQELYRFMANLKSSKSYTCNYKDKTINILIQMSKNWAEELHKVLDDVTDFFAQKGIVTGCAICGKVDSSISLCDVTIGKKYICTECYKAATASAPKHYPQPIGIVENENIILGVIGALLGSLIGVLLWVIIGSAGYIAGIAGAVMGICSLFGYKKLSGKLSTRGIVICVLIMIAMVYFSTRLSWAVNISDALRKEGYDTSVSDSFKSLPKLMELTDTTGDFYTDLLVGYVLTAVASGATIIKSLNDA